MNAKWTQRFGNWSSVMPTSGAEVQQANEGLEQVPGHDGARASYLVDEMDRTQQVCTPNAWCTHVPLHTNTLHMQCRCWTSSRQGASIPHTCAGNTDLGHFAGLLQPPQMC